MGQKCRKFLVFFAVIVLGGCASFGVYNAATERHEFIFIPTDYEVKMGQDIHQQIASQYKISTDKAAVERLRRIGQKLAQVSDRQDFEYQFYLVDCEFTYSNKTGFNRGVFFRNFRPNRTRAGRYQPF